MNTNQIKAINDTMSFIAMVSDPRNTQPTSGIEEHINYHVSLLKGAGIPDEVCDHFIALINLSVRV